MPDIDIADLGVQYGRAVALREATFKVHEGEFVTLLGPSGCGKTTTLMSVAGMTSPTRGRITCGEDVFVDVAARRELPPERRNCGVVFQSYAIWSHMTVADNVGYPLKLRNVGKSDRIERVRAALDLVGMSRYEQRYPHELSGGQQQRVALARAVVYSPGVLLLDEPLSNLDAKLREQARVWLKDVQERTGLTTVFVTHDQSEALSMSDRVVVMSEGRIEQIGAPEDVYRDPATGFVADFIGSSNLLPGRLVEGGPAGRRVQLGRSGPVIDVAGPQHLRGDETSVLVGIRPEAIRLRPSRPGGPEPGDHPAKISSAMFMGDHYQYRVVLTDTELYARSEQRIEGDDVDVRLVPTACSLYSSEEPHA